MDKIQRSGPKHADCTAMGKFDVSVLLVLQSVDDLSSINILLGRTEIVPAYLENTPPKW